MYTYMCIYINVYIHIHIRIHVHIYTYISRSRSIYIYHVRPVFPFLQRGGSTGCDHHARRRDERT